MANYLKKNGFYLHLKNKANDPKGLTYYTELCLWNFINDKG